LSHAVPLGLHHVTALAGPAQPSVDFYTGMMGLRLVKLTVNFDAPSVYHVYYADDAARPGSVLTLFPFPDAAPGRAGAGEAVEVAHVVPAGAHAYWMDRFAERDYEAWDAPETRFGESVLRLRDPDGTPLALVEDAAVTGGWEGGSVPVEAAAGALHSATLASKDPEATARLLVETMGYRESGKEGDRLRFVNRRADRAGVIDLVPAPAEPGRSGKGTIHHVAFRVAGEEAHLEVREAIATLGLRPTPVIDRQYFRSVYFREPGGVLFELATDLPGFDVDEPADTLGRSLKLPPQYEPRRAEIEAALPSLRVR
jgi:glyoxalase family protein